MATQTKRDYYEVLGVARTASAQEIKSAFQRLVLDFQLAGKPRNIDDVEEIRSIASAYRLLSDPEKRHRYQQTGYCFSEDSTIENDVLTQLEEETQANWNRARDLVAALLEGFLTGIS